MKHLRSLLSYWPLVACYVVLSFLFYQTHIRPLARIQSEFGKIHATEPEQIFEMIDGYFLAGSWGSPVHLIHGPVEKQGAWLGDDLHFTIKIALMKDAVNPCSDRDEKPCEAELGLTNSTDDSCPQCTTNHVRIGEDGILSMGFGGKVSRKQPKGENRFLFRVTKDGKVLFAYQIPVEVR